MKQLSHIFSNSSLLQHTEKKLNVKEPMTMIKNGYYDDRIVIKAPK